MPFQKIWNTRNNPNGIIVKSIIKIMLLRNPVLPNYPNSCLIDTDIATKSDLIFINQRLDQMQHSISKFGLL